MRWLQFFRRVNSMDAQASRKLMEGLSGSEFNLVDVREPKEYKTGHLPGAQLMPMGELEKRSEELDPELPTLVYWAIGGRSRVAAQMLTDKGFKNVINMAGGIKAWKGNKAVGPEDTGLYLFTGAETLSHVLVVAYSLENGLHDFYVSMIERVTNKAVKDLFEKLAKIEIIHQERLLTEFRRETGTDPSMEEFEQTHVVAAMEGGLTTDEYIELYQPDFESETEVVSLAMAIEAQALDLYQRTADKATSEDVRQALMRIADEERLHLKQLAGLLN